MSNVKAVLPRKAMSDIECQFLKIAGEELAKVKMGGPAALAALLDMVASWHSSRLQIGFHDYGQRWLLEGNAKKTAADRLLRDLFGLSDPDPRKAA
ncbi:hypothetical protein J3P84_23610 [Pseudomonas sp. Z1-29]|jgi:hypothetical protein|uniref:hypothetical protein n=1 Tax=Pseudomonas TaxID=286 RepID=UPI0016474D5E|nr:hypothetical protein [Pseudomonas zarinae]QXH96095.1 hypothetical protein HU749_006825 [Pseudomonas zarinae]